MKERYKKFFEEELLNYWNVIDYYSLDKEAETIHDIWIKWHNKNSISAMLQLIKNKNYKMVGHLNFYLDNILKERNSGVKIISIKNFEQSLNSLVSLWRGGSGFFDKNYNYQNQKFVSYTSDFNRVKTFSIYAGTYVSSAFSLNKNKNYWIVELQIPLKNILAYLDVQDHEAIISIEDNKKAKLIEQK